MKYSILIFFKSIISKLFIRLSEDEKHLIFGNDLSIGTYQEFCSKDDFKLYEKRLYDGLDAKSKHILKRIISRIKKVVFNHKNLLLLSLDEIINLYLATKEKQKAIKQIEENFSYFNYKLPCNHFNSGIFYDKYFIEDFDTLEKIKKGDILDVGGYIGDSAIVLANYSRVHVFEPVTQNYEALLKTINLNQSKFAITPYKLGLGKEHQTLFINIYEESGVASTLKEDRKNEKNNVREEIQINTLDEVVKKYNIVPSLIKIDIEGAEEDFLLGAIETIKHYKPAIILSIYHSGKDFFTLKSKIENLNLGYTFKIRKASKYKILDDTILLCEVNNV